MYNLKNTKHVLIVIKLITPSTAMHFAFDVGDMINYITHELFLK